MSSGSFAVPRFGALALVSFCSSVYSGIDVPLAFDARQMTDKPTTVHVAGSFNGWNNQAFALTDPDGDLVFTGTLKLDEGEYQYKFVLDANTPRMKWIEDPSADAALHVPDGHQGFNSVMIVGPGAGKKFDPPKAHHINTEAVAFDLANSSDFAVGATTTRVRIRVLAGDVEKVIAGANDRTVHLKKIATERNLDVYAGIIAVKPPFVFFIGLEDGNAMVSIDRSGVAVQQGPDIRLKPYEVDQVNDDAPPSWAADANWYQVFVERFRNGDPSNDPGDFPFERLVPWNGDWFSALPGETPGDENFYRGAGNVWNRRYGGDLAGLREKLPYLRSLGVNALYLNPMFEAESMHKYDTADFRHIDDNFGTRDPNSRGILGNRQLFNLDGSPVASGHVETEDPATWRWTKSDLLFLDFLKDARQQGFRVVIDGVFNHVGRAHPFFMDVLANGKHSKYADWFEITDWGDEANWKISDVPFSIHGKPGGIQWKAWDSNNGYLPVFKKSAETGLAHGPREHILAIATRWGNPDGDPNTHDGIDGWRLDVPGDVPHPFWIDFRKAVRAAYPDSYIVGEIWSPAQAWINNGDQFDAVMNYQFAQACQDFFVDVKDQITPSAFNDRLVKLWFMYPHQSALAMQNLFDSHDTDRAVSMFVNPDRPYDGQNRPQDNAASNPYDPRKPNETEWSRFLQMVAFQQCFLGAPMTYYGNEVGMWSPDDPSNRQPLPWEDRGPYQNGVGFHGFVFDSFQRFIAIRNHLPALRRGDYFPVKVDDDANLIAFGRSLNDSTVYVVINRSNVPRAITIDVDQGVYVDFADPQSVKIEMSTNANARPMPVLLDGARKLDASAGKVTIDLREYGTAVLVRD